MLPSALGSARCHTVRSHPTALQIAQHRRNADSRRLTPTIAPTIAPTLPPPPLTSQVQQLQGGKKGNMLPVKRMMGNLTAAVIEERRQGLERYLQRLVNGEKEVVFSPALLKFLEVNEHNVIWVAQHLARHLQLYGDRTLRSSRFVALDRTVVSWPIDVRTCALRAFSIPVYIPVDTPCCKVRALSYPVVLSHHATPLVAPCK